MPKQLSAFVPPNLIWWLRPCRLLAGIELYFFNSTPLLPHDSWRYKNLFLISINQISEKSTPNERGIVCVIFSMPVGLALLDPEI